MTPKSMWPAVKAMLHSVYDQPDAAAVHAQFDRLLDYVKDKLPRRLRAPRPRPRGPAVLHRLPQRGLDQDLVHNPTERLNKEIRRRTDAVGIFLCVPLGTGGSMRGAARLVEVPRMTRNLSVDPHEGLTRLGPVSSAPRGWLRDLIAA